MGAAPAAARPTGCLRGRRPRGALPGSLPRRSGPAPRTAGGFAFAGRRRLAPAASRPSGAAMSGRPAAGEGSTPRSRGAVVKEVLINLILCSYSKWDFFPSRRSRQARSRAGAAPGRCRDSELPRRWCRRVPQAGSPPPGQRAELGLPLKLLPPHNPRQRVQSLNGLLGEGRASASAGQGQRSHQRVWLP